MHNPLTLLSPPLLAALLQEPKLFVREYYPRGREPLEAPNTLPVLLTYYEKGTDVEINRAQFHLRQLQPDSCAFLYDSDVDAHRQRLLQAAMQPSPYKIYINLLATTWQPPISLRNQIHTYMQHHLSWWRYTKTNRLHIQLKDRYGKLFLHLSWKGNRAEVLLDDIENIRTCATT